MRTALLGILIGAGLMLVTLGILPGDNEAVAQRAGPLGPNATDRGVIAFSNVVENKYEQVTVIDPQRMAMSVYHVELATGDIELKSVRTIHWDLQMTYYNGKGLSPQEIHSLQESK